MYLSSRQSQKEITVQSTVFTTGPQRQWRDASFCYVFKKNNRRNGRYAPTSKAQQRVNEKNATYKLTYLIQENFCEGVDFWVHPTFDDDHLPETVEDMLKIVRNFINRIKELYIKAKVIKKKSEFKYICTYAGDGKVRKHLHLVMMGCKDKAKRAELRDAIEEIWCEYYGLSNYCNVDKLRADKKVGFFGTASYLCGNHRESRENGEPATVKRWTCSRNLKRPEPAYRKDALPVSFLPKLASASEFDRIKMVEGLRMFKGYKAVEVEVSELKDAPEEKKHRIFGNYYVFVRARKKTPEELKEEQTTERRKNEPRKDQYTV